MDEKVVEKSEQELKNEFYVAYQELCHKYGLNITVIPGWRLSRDNGDWRLVLQVSVGKLPPQNSN